MKGGFGTASIMLENGLVVAAAVAVMLCGLWQARQGDARAGQKLLKQGMWVAMAAFIVGSGL